MPHNPAKNPDPDLQLAKARKIAPHFDIPGPLEVGPFTGKGNINQQTFLVAAGPIKDKEQYLLQQLNPVVFTRPHAVMDRMISCISAQQRALSQGGVKAEEWETMRLIPTKSGSHYLTIGGETDGECWRMMVKIRNVCSYRSLREIPDRELRLRVAEEAGRGLAVFGRLTAGMDISEIEPPLPGYRETENYFGQLESVLAGCRSLEQAAAFLPQDPVLRNSTGAHFLVQTDEAEYHRRLSDPQLQGWIDLALEHRMFGLTLSRKLKSGELRRVVVHGDTKLDNFLFSTVTGRVKALVDLDTIMPHTWLSDWGDMARSLSNIAGEREEDPGKIEVNQGILRALAKGFLGSFPHVMPHETELMVDAAQIMALELAVRFLADYLRGDSYFRLGDRDPRDLNKTRAMVQFRLYERMRREADSLKQIVRSCRR